MPRNISFALTTRQFNDGSKDVTRRMGWLCLEVDDILMAVEKSQGLGKGGKVKRLGLIRVVKVGPEPLSRLVDDRAYGLDECRREGFAQMSPEDFIVFFCKTHKGCTISASVTRIEFVKV